MAITVAYIFTRVQNYFSDIPQDVFLNLLNEADNEIQPDARIYPQETTSLNLVANQQEYDYDDDITRILKVGYLAAQGSYVDLREFTVDYLDYKYPGWRGQPSGTPFCWYQLGGKMGFYPTPLVATNAGYPIVKIFNVPQGPTLTMMSSIPGVPRVANAWVYAVCMKWADGYHQDKSQFFERKYALAKNDLIRYVSGRNLRRKSGVHPRVPQVQII